jgi:hypothetical protein
LEEEEEEVEEEPQFEERKDAQYTKDKRQT